MNKIFLSLMISVCLVMNVRAKNPTGLTFSIQTGISKPLSPQKFSDSYRTGANFGVGVGKQLFSNLFVQGIICYNEFTFDRNGFEDTFETEDKIVAVEGGGAYIMNFLGRAKIIYPHKPGSKGMSYLFGGVGINQVSEKHIDVLAEENDIRIPGRNETVLGTELGLGVDVMFEGTNLFIEIGLNVSFTEEKKDVYFPLKFGIAF